MNDPSSSGVPPGTKHGEGLPKNLPLRSPKSCAAAAGHSLLWPAEARSEEETRATGNGPQRPSGPAAPRRGPPPPAGPRRAAAAAAAAQWRPLPARGRPSSADGHGGQGGAGAPLAPPPSPCHQTPPRSGGGNRSRPPATRLQGSPRLSVTRASSSPRPTGDGGVAENQDPRESGLNARELPSPARLGPESPCPGAESSPGPYRTYGPEHKQRPPAVALQFLITQSQTSAISVNLQTEEVENISESFSPGD